MKQFRIRSLMGWVLGSAVLLTAWHVFPAGRFNILVVWIGFSVIDLPLEIVARKHPKPWSKKQIAGAFVYKAFAFAAIFAIVYHFGRWNAVLETWPG